LAANTDRNDTNWGAITALPDAVLIDHGHCFTKSSNTTSAFFQHRHDQQIPAALLNRVEAFVNNASNTHLREVLDEPVVDQVIERARHLVQDGKLTLP
jgi:hypothetical protein